NAFAEDGLRRVFPERATATPCRGAADGWQRSPTGEEIASRRTRPAVVSGTTRRSAGAGTGRCRTTLPQAGPRTPTRRTRSAARRRARGRRGRLLPNGGHVLAPRALGGDPRLVVHDPCHADLIVREVVDVGFCVQAFS